MQRLNLAKWITRQNVFLRRMIIMKQGIIDLIMM